MSVISLGSIKRAPVFSQFDYVKVKWGNLASNSAAKIPVTFNFRRDRSYLVFIRSRSGEIEIEGSNVLVDTVNVLTNFPDGLRPLNCGEKFTIFGSAYAYGITFPFEVNGDFGIYVRKPDDTSLGAIFSVGIFEL